jgi:hypothetical protein
LSDSFYIVNLQSQLLAAVQLKDESLVDTLQAELIKHEQMGRPLSAPDDTDSDSRKRPSSAPLAGDGPAGGTKKRKIDAAAAGPEVIEDLSWTVCKQKKTRKLDGAVAATVPAAAAADEVSWTVCCCDGATFSVALPDHARVAEAKRAIGVQRDVSRFAMELFVEGEEEPLDDERRLSVADKVPLFMLLKEEGPSVLDATR